MQLQMKNETMHMGEETARKIVTVMIKNWNIDQILELQV